MKIEFTRARRAVFCLGSFLFFSLVGTNAYAALVPTPPTAIASGLGYIACIEAAEIDGKVTWIEKGLCATMVFDPSPADVTAIDISFEFDANKFSVRDIPLFFGDFSESGTYLPLVAPVTGGKQSLEEINDSIFDPNLALKPRTGSTYLFEVDNVAGTVHFFLDTSANPIAGNSPPQNFFGFQIETKSGQSFSNVEYFDAPGIGYDLAQTSFLCTRLDDLSSGCGSDTPVNGMEFGLVSEPSAAALMGLALLGIVGTSRKSIRCRRENHVGRSRTLIWL